MKKITIPVCFVAFLTLGTACNSNSGSDNTSDSATTSTTTETTVDTSMNKADTSSVSASTSNAPDGEFVIEAASGGLMEVELGKTASTNAASPKVKEFGKMMVTDHTKANTELKALAAKKNITVPAAPMEKHQSHITDLKAKKGADFDKDYVDMMVDDHKEDIKKFEDESKNGKDPDIKAFATKTLPVLNKHLASIQSIQQGMKK